MAHPPPPAPRIDPRPPRAEPTGQPPEPPLRPEDDLVEKEFSFFHFPETFHHSTPQPLNPSTRQPFHFLSLPHQFLERFFNRPENFPVDPVVLDFPPPRQRIQFGCDPGSCHVVNGSRFCGQLLSGREPAPHVRVEDIAMINPNPVHFDIFKINRMMP